MSVELPSRCYNQILEHAILQPSIANKIHDGNDEIKLPSKVSLSSQATHFLKTVLSYTLTITEYCRYMSVLPNHVLAALDVFMRVDYREYVMNEVEEEDDDDESVDPTWMGEDDSASIDAYYIDEEPNKSGSFNDRFQSMNRVVDWGINDKMFYANFLRPIILENFKCDVEFKKGSAGILKNAMFAFLVKEMAK
ncbi:hypothetical protein ACHAXS_012745 [Conticribra weissflogii]